MPRRGRGPGPLRVYLTFFLTLASVLAHGCGTSNNGGGTGGGTGGGAEEWVYFDRELYFASGSAVSPEEAAAQSMVQAALTELQNKTDLGADFFIFSSSDSSLLQPVTGPTTYRGVNWKSFYQVWDDKLFNDFAAQNLGSASDEDVVVAQNEQAKQQFYIIARLSCFIAGDSCKNASQAEAKALVWRSVGYLIGLRNGDQSASPVMKAGMDPSQVTPEAESKFLAEFNGMLERIRKNLPPPTGSNGTGGTRGTAETAVTTAAP